MKTPTTFSNPDRNGGSADDNLQPLIKTWIQEGERSWSHATLAANTTGMTDFCRYRDEHRRQPLNEALINAYVRKLRLVPNGAADIPRQLSVLKSFFVWAVSHKRLGSDPTRGLKAARSFGLPAHLRPSAELLPAPLRWRNVTVTDQERGALERLLDQAAQSNPKRGGRGPSAVKRSLKRSPNSAT